MNDPWDVKSRQVGQYVSCMKLNGVPLLPPVLSKECRKEMQYYKLLAKEVEKRISELSAYVMDSDEDSAQDHTDVPELPQEYEQPSECEQEILQEVETKVTTFRDENDSFSECTMTSTLDLCNSVTSSIMSRGQPKLSVDLSLQNDSGKNNSSVQQHPQPIELPERDCNTPKKNKKVDTENELSFSKTPEREMVDVVRVEFEISKVEPLVIGAFPDMTMTDEPPSLSSRSFTGSLNNIHSESVKEVPTLVRQSSYTVLNPSPMLLAHLRVQSLSTGVEVTSISMSDSLSTLSPKKRRNWDLESAKIKWSSMAHELKQKSTAQSKIIDNKYITKPTVKKLQQNPPRAKSVQEKLRRASLPGKTPKSEPLPKTKKSTPSPYATANSTNVKEPKPTNNTQASPMKLISECEDPAAKVRELYERIQNQQLLQMANLVEKQKQEQMLLQQVFDEQNSILYRQLKTICPKSSIEVKAAWADKVDRGPVSLSQLINNQSPDSLTSTLTDTHNNLNKCAEVLKKSKYITGSIKKRPDSPVDRSVTRPHSPKRTSTSRKLSYDTSSSDREFEPILTDRTNDTLTGLNVTFTSDSDEPTFFEKKKRASTDSATQSMQSQHVQAVPARKPFQARLPPTPEQLAAASTIVAHAKGYLVRRLLRTERVQATVQTIRDALLCALQMHQDRAGIRGADVDLHRRLIQQITAACYSLHDTFVASTPAERCALIAADRERRRQKPGRHSRHEDIMSQSHSGAFPARAPRSSAHSLMTQSNYETFSGAKLNSRYMPSPRRRPWR